MNASCNRSKRKANNLTRWDDHQFIKSERLQLPVIAV